MNIDVPNALIMKLNVYMTKNWMKKPNFERNARTIVEHAKKILHHHSLTTKIVPVLNLIEDSIGNFVPSESELHQFREFVLEAEPRYVIQIV